MRRKRAVELPVPRQSFPDPNAGPVSYVEYPLQRLKQAVPLLQGLQADSNQGRLSFVLPKVAR